MADDSLIIYALEAYVTSIYDEHTRFLNRWHSDMTRVQLGVTPRRFTRHIYRRSEGRDVFLSQNLVDTGTIQVFTLRKSAGINRFELYNAIVAEQEWYSFDHPELTGHRVARAFSDYAEMTGVLGLGKPPFAICGDQAFGTVHVMGTLGRFQDSFADVDLNVIDAAISCNMCEKEYALEDNERSTIGFHCQHTFHNKCIYPYMWTCQVHNPSRSGYNVPCPVCDLDMIVLFDD